MSLAACSQAADIRTQTEDLLSTSLRCRVHRRPPIAAATLGSGRRGCRSTSSKERAAWILGELGELGEYVDEVGIWQPVEPAQSDDTVAIVPLP